MDPDPLARGTDPGIRIRTKMQWILNTACKSITYIFFVKFALKMLDILLSSSLTTLESDFATTGILDCLLLYARREGQRGRVIGFQYFQASQHQAISSPPSDHKSTELPLLYT